MYSEADFPGLDMYEEGLAGFIDPYERDKNVVPHSIGDTVKTLYQHNGHYLKLGTIVGYVWNTQQEQVYLVKQQDDEYKGYYPKYIEWVETPEPSKEEIEAALRKIWELTNG